MRVILSLALILPAILANGAPQRRLVADKRGWFACGPETIDFPKPSAESATDEQEAPEIPLRTNFTAEDVANAQIGRHYYMKSTDKRVAECAVYHAPLCYDGICEDPEDRKVDIFFKRIQANDEDPSKYPNVWFIQGGPGASSIVMEYSMMEMYELMGGKVNVYTMDHRGTGRSTKLDCVGAQAYTSGGPEGQSLSSIEVPECAADLQQKYGDLSSFSVTTAATDLATFISTETTDSETYMFGVSYGTVVGERLIHLKPKEIKGYILDGVASTAGASADKFVAFSKWEESFGEVGDIFLSRCDTTPECKARFSERTLTEVLDGLIKKLEENPGSDCGLFLNTVYGGMEPPSFLVRRFLGLLLTSQRGRTLIPVLVHRLDRCNANDLNVLQYFLQAFIALRSGNDPASLESDTYDSDLLYSLIRYSELWETPMPDEETMLQRFLKHRVVSGNMYYSMLEYCAFSKEKSKVCDKYNVADYDAQPIIYKRDQYFNQSATIPEGSSVLIMNGILDPQTPAKNAEALYEVMKGEENQKKLVIFEHNAHAVISNTFTTNADEPTCAMQMIVSYVSNGGDLTKTDMSCLDRMAPMSFEVPEDLAEKLLNTDDPYDGVLKVTTANDEDAPVEGKKDVKNDTSTEATSYKTPFIVFTVLFAIAAVIAGVAIATVMRLRRGQSKQASAEQVLTPNV